MMLKKNKKKSRWKQITDGEGEGRRRRKTEWEKHTFFKTVQIFIGYNLVKKVKCFCFYKEREFLSCSATHFMFFFVSKMGPTARYFPAK